MSINKRVYSAYRARHENDPTDQPTSQPTNQPSNGPRAFSPSRKLLGSANGCPVCRSALYRRRANPPVQVTNRGERVLAVAAPDQHEPRPWDRRSVAESPRRGPDDGTMPCDATGSPCSTTSARGGTGRRRWRRGGPRIRLPYRYCWCCCCWWCAVRRGNRATGSTTMGTAPTRGTGGPRRGRGAPSSAPWCRRRRRTTSSSTRGRVSRVLGGGSDGDAEGFRLGSAWKCESFVVGCHPWKWCQNVCREAS